MARTHVLERVQHFPLPREALFAFFTDASNLAEITPPFLNFRILTPMPVEMRSGAELEYRLRLYGLPVHWITDIEDFEAPARFTDRQRKGPYRLWHHTHAFEPVEGGTRMTDTVRYQLPFGPLGSLAHALLVRRTLRKIFDYRESVLRQRFGELRSPG